MEGDSSNREACAHMFHLIHKDRQQWVVRGDEGRFGVAEEKNLELRLAPPGENWFTNEKNIINNNYNNRVRYKSPLSLGNNNGNQNQELSLLEKQTMGTVFSSPWCSGTSSQSPFHFQSITQSVAVMQNESSHTCSTKVELKNNPEKKACSPSSVNNSSHKRVASAPIVGWPPIRSSRKNLASNSSSKLASQSENEITPKEANKSLLIKINMDGVPIGRKVDLKVYDSYEKLSSAVDELFRGLLAAQRDSPAIGNHNKIAEVEEITGLLDGNGEYTLVYEDNEGDRMLVGDVPWDMFASMVKRLRVLKSSELSTLRLGNNKQENTPLDSAMK